MLDLEEIPLPESWQQCAEKRELLRQVAVGMLRNPRLDPASRPFAEHFAAQPRLTVPLSAGMPMDHVHGAQA